MTGVMQIIASQTGGKSFNTYRYSLDSIGVPSIQYDDTSDKVLKWRETAETIKHVAAIPLKHIADKIINEDSILKYFLDGSRRVYKVDDISYDNQVFPVVAGQIGVGCCKRIERRMTPEKFHRELVLSLPDKSYDGCWQEEQFFQNLVDTLNQSDTLQKIGLNFSKILTYKTSKKNDPHTNLENLAISTIQDYMIESEKQMVADLVKERKLNQDNFLIKDGSLEYKIMKRGKESLRELQKIKNNYNWVIGVSKSFNPESCMDHKGRPNSDYIADLPVFHRTPVAKYENQAYLGDVAFGVWYIRLREKKHTLTPFDGVVKVEKIMMDDELENGIDSELVDLLSACIINERNPTCYGADRRWANHIYPIFVTEQYIKSKYISTSALLRLF